ncbi:hypothetical protein J132_10804 [Termitomyces sp. J132]|nr:hypothetical protein J132_10804 [Termitomyces sp. J132]
MRWFKQVNSSEFDYLPVLTKLEEDDRRSQLSLESENTRRNGHRSASVRRIQTKISSKHTTGGVINLSNHGSQDPLMQQLKWENQQMDEMISRRAQGRQSVPFVSLANDNAAQNLLDGMRQDSERLRSARAQQPPADTSDSDLQRLRDEVENLRRENDIYRSLERQTRQTPQRVADTEAERLRDEVDNLRRENERLQTQLIASYFSPPEYAPPPYVRAD